MISQLSFRVASHPGTGTRYDPVATSFHCASMMQRKRQTRQGPSRNGAEHLCAEALLGVEAASGEGEGLEKGSGGGTSMETASREGRRSREPMERRALLRRQAFFSCGFRHVAHCMHLLGRLPPEEVGLPLPACTQRYQLI